MRDVAAWLQELGLSKYAKAFADHEIDFEALPHLTEKMLEELGLPIGPRARLLAAVARLASPPAAPAASAGAARAADTEPAVPLRQDERRQITVMFCDLVDSTRLSRELDPEDYKAVMQAYQSACGSVIARYEGHISQYRGDGIEVYFGWPAAQEDAAERAVRAGLEIVEAVKASQSPRPLSGRVGISTGIVVISAAGSGDPSIPSGAVGDTPNIAARLEALAGPGGVVIAEATSRLIAGRFDEEPLGPQALKGIAEPIRAFRVRQVREDSSRFHATHTAGLTPLVGRRTELALLQQRWRDANEGEGQVVYLSGVPGIGKSRIVYELERWIGAEPHVSLRFQCLPHHTQSPLFPVIQRIQRMAKLAPDDSPEARLDKLRTLLALTTDKVDRALPLLAELLSIPVEARHAPVGLSAVQVKIQTLFVLVELLLDLAARRPVFCLIEDAQWIDPSTQELLDLLVDRIGKARILLVVTHRPENQPRAGVHSNVSALNLSRLRRSDVAEMAQLALREHAVSSVVLQRLIDESDAIPLFIEELARGVLESAGARERAGYDARTPSAASWSVPDSLRDSLMARLDRAPQARSVAQMAAVIGREFSYDMLLRVSSLGRAEVDAALAHLQRSEIVQQIDTEPLTRYAFKHALLRDAAYESALRSTRRGIHATVAAALEKESPEIVAAQPELLAYHHGLAGDAAAALRFWMLGGQRARSRSANHEAAGQFQKALECLEALPETPERVRTELEIQLALGLCFIALHGYSADDTRGPFERARALSAQLGEPPKEIQALFGLWGHYWMRARHDRAIELAETLLAKAALLRDPVAVVVGHRAIGSTLFTRGEFVRAREHLERAIRMAAEADAKGLSMGYAVDPGIAAQLVLAWDLWILGYPARALDNVLQALAQALERGDPYSIAFAHYVTSAVLLLRGEAQGALKEAEASLALSTEHRIGLYALYSRFGRGCALAGLGQHGHALAEIQNGIEEAERTNLRYLRGFMLGWLATARAANGELESALSTIDEAFRHINDDAGRAWEAELHRLRGEILRAARPDAAGDAERSYRDAIAVAVRQRARSLELRASTALAQLLRTQGRRSEALRVLAPVYDWFSEGLDTADLRTARTLLDELR